MGPDLSGCRSPSGLLSTKALNHCDDLIPFRRGKPSPANTCRQVARKPARPAGSGFGPANWACHGPWPWGPRGKGGRGSHPGPAWCLALPIPRRPGAQMLPYLHYADNGKKWTGRKAIAHCSASALLPLQLQVTRESIAYTEKQGELRTRDAGTVSDRPRNVEQVVRARGNAVSIVSKRAQFSTFAR